MGERKYITKTIDEIFDEIGHFGKFQKIKYTFICVPAIFTCLAIMNSNYVDAVPDHRCFVPGFDNASHPVFNAPWVNRTIPHVKGKNGQVKFSECKMYTPNRTIVACHKFVYDTSTFKSTTVTQWNLVCQHKSLQAFPSSVYMVGVLLGSFFFGLLGDRIGRKNCLIIAAILFVLCLNTVVFVPTFALYLIARYMTGMAAQGIYMSSYVIGLEMVGGSMRLFAGTVINITYGIGFLIMAALGYFLRDWHQLYLAFSIPSLILLPLIFFIPKSARWLLSRGRIAEATSIMKRAAKMNGVDFKKDFSLRPERPLESKGETLLHVIRSPVLLCRLANLSFSWIINAMFYYGLSLNANSFGVDIYISLVLFGAIEFVGYGQILLFLNRFGRTRPTVVWEICAGLSGIIAAFIPETSSALIIVRLALALVCKFCICGSFATLYILTGELYPTSVRNSVIGTTCMFARLGSIGAPFILLLAAYETFLPMCIFGSMSLVGGILMFLLPDTKNITMPNTIAEAKNLGKQVCSDSSTEPTISEREPLIGS